MSQCDFVVPLALSHTNEATCTSPWFVRNTEYHPTAIRYRPLVNGEEAFRAVHQAIVAAKKSIDIICWGFQPSMYFIRDGQAPCIGQLLIDKAQAGVAVRILGWEAPFNAAGLGGEANLPGKGMVRIKDRVGQTATEAQYDFDLWWFSWCSVTDKVMVPLMSTKIPLFVSRGFDFSERAEIAYRATFKSIDPDISLFTVGALAGTVTHHQKSVIVDYELPDCAVGFVMGHNMIDEYWDTDRHSACNRSLDSRPAPNLGANGKLPRQDISSQVSGSILEHMHHNFATAWAKETGENLLASRKSEQVAKQLKFGHGEDQLLIAQLLRTQPQKDKRDIERLYLQAINNATNFIYIENQYFRWPPLADAIKKAAADQTRAGRTPSKHGNLHLFVITNNTDEGMGAGTVNTQRMLESLGRPDMIPQVTKLRRIEQAQARAAARGPSWSEQLENKVLRGLTSLADGLGGTRLNDKAQEDERQRQAILEKEIEEIKTIDVVGLGNIPGLKVHICSLVAPDSPAGLDWMPVYIHSKLMIIDDVFTTHGSANINTRSMQVDSELNIAHERESVTKALRRRLWGMHTDKREVQDDPKKAFDDWQSIIKKNKDRQDDKKNGVPFAPLVEFYYSKATLKDLD